MQIIQELFALIKITEIIGNIGNKLTTIKNFIFSAFIFPNAIFVATVFWFAYLYDREWGHPKELDEYVPQWYSHVGHTLILLPVVVEIFQKNTTAFYPKYSIAFVCLNGLLLAHHMGFVLIQLHNK